MNIKELKSYPLLFFPLILLSFQSVPSYARGDGGHYAYHATSNAFHSSGYKSGFGQAYGPRNPSGNRVYQYKGKPEDHYTQAYTRQNGTPVKGYHATNPNGRKFDNYSAPKRNY